MNSASMKNSGIYSRSHGVGEAKVDNLVFLKHDPESLSPGWDVELERLFQEQPEMESSTIKY